MRVRSQQTARFAARSSGCLAILYRSVGYPEAEKITWTRLDADSCSGEFCDSYELACDPSRSLQTPMTSIIGGGQGGDWMLGPSGGKEGLNVRPESSSPELGFGRQRLGTGSALKGTRSIVADSSLHISVSVTYVAHSSISPPEARFYSHRLPSEAPQEFC